MQAIEAGAFWYIEKPLKPPVLRALLDRALGRVRDQQAVAALTRRSARARESWAPWSAPRAPMQEVMRQVEMAAPSTASVLITGETGSGKEMVARSIHMLSPRAERPFVAINCSAIPESLMESEIFGHEKGAFTGAAERRIGCFELADGGTLLARRNRRDARAHAGKTAARARGPQGPAAGQQGRNAGRRARPCGDEQESRAGRGGRPPAPGPLLPAERLPHSPAAVARAQGRSAAAGRASARRTSPRSTARRSPAWART